MYCGKTNVANKSFNSQKMHCTQEPMFWIAKAAATFVHVCDALYRSYLKCVNFGFRKSAAAPRPTVTMNVYKYIFSGWDTQIISKKNEEIKSKKIGHFCKQMILA